MVTMVKQQPPFEYYWWIVMLAVLLLVGGISLLLYTINKYFELGLFTRRSKNLINKPPRKALLQIKNEYALKLQDLAAGYNSKTITKREAYQSLSLLIRGFVHEATGINVENYTKSEIKALGMPSLDRLMAEYYVPEFAEDERAMHKDFIQSARAALGVIGSWK